MVYRLWWFSAIWLCVIQGTLGIKVNWNSRVSIRKAASTMAYDMMTFYQGNQTGFTPGILGPPYYWWEGGAMWGALIQYWHYTGDSTYNEVTMQGLQYQVGEFDDYMPQDHRSELGNDDQAFWAIAAMQAVETNFPDPPPDQPSWLGLVQAVFNEQVGRWDNETCGGGLRWQIYVKGGYNIKNTISNGCFFQIAARLARYTGEDLYKNWAIKAWDWMWAVDLINHETYDIYDNTEADLNNCTGLEKLQWSYNPAVLLLGAATMYNITDGSPLWRNRTTKLLTRIKDVFFPNATATELCELHEVCNIDQKSFKAYLARWMASTTQLAPFTYPTIYPLLLNSAKEASKQCNGGPSATKCGIKWWLNGTWDGSEPGVGQQMSALEFTLGTLIKRKEQKPGADDGEDDDDHDIRPPVTGDTGGTSKPDPDAGHDASRDKDTGYVPPPTIADKIGAWFLTAFLMCACIAGVWFMLGEGFEEAAREEKRRVRESRLSAAENVVLDLKGKGRESAGSGFWKETGGVGEMEVVAEEKGRDMGEVRVESESDVGDEREVVTEPTRAVRRESIPKYRGGGQTT